MSCATVRKRIFRGPRYGVVTLLNNDALGTFEGSDAEAVLDAL